MESHAGLVGDRSLECLPLCAFGAGASAVAPFAATVKTIRAAIWSKPLQHASCAEPMDVDARCRQTTYFRGNPNVRLRCRVRLGLEMPDQHVRVVRTGPRKALPEKLCVVRQYNDDFAKRPAG